MEAQPLPTAPTPEAQAPETSATPPREKVSPQVQALMRKEAEIVRKAQQTKRLEAQLKAEREALAAEKARVDAFERTWKENPLKAVTERGLTPEQLWMMQQQGGQMTPEVQIKFLMQEIESLKKERLEEKSKSQESEAAKAEREATEQVEAFKGEISQFVETNAEKYPLTALYKRADLIYSVIDRHHEKTADPETGIGEVMPIEKASELVEARLLQEAQKAQEILQKTAKPNPPQTPPEATTGRRYVPERGERWSEKPVSSLAQVQQSVPPSVPSRFKTEEEREANALALLRAAKQRRGLA